MTFDKILDLTAGVYFYFYNIYLLYAVIKKVAYIYSCLYHTGINRDIKMSPTADDARR